MTYFNGINAQVWRIVGLQVLAMTALNVNIIGTGLVGALLAPAAWLATLPFSVQLIATMFASLPASLLMVSFGRRPIFALGLLLAAISMCLQAFAIFQENFSLFLIASGLFGIANGVAPFYRYAAADAVPAEVKPKALSLVMAAGLASAFIGPEIAYRAPGLVEGALFAGCYIVGAAVLLLGVPILYGLKLPKPDLAKGHGRPISSFFKKRDFVLAVIAASLGYAFMSFVMTATPLQVVNVAQLGIEANARIIQWHVIGMFGPSFVTGILISHFGVRKILWAGVLLYGLCLSLALSGASFWYYFSALLLLGVGWNFLFIGGSTVIASYARPEERGRVQGVADFVILSCVALASLAAGVAHSTFGWELLLQLAILPMGIIAFCLVITRSRPQ